MSTPTRLDRFSPVFGVRDLQRALDHYAMLGFATRGYDDGQYGYADRDQVGLHLATRRRVKARTSMSTATLSGSGRR